MDFIRAAMFGGQERVGGFPRPTQHEDKANEAAEGVEAAPEHVVLWGGERHGLRLVLISDTHGAHRKVDVPHGDLLIHAGDFTRFGKLEDADDFNAWLGEQPRTRKIVVFGNHECNSAWRDEAETILSNATLLVGAGVVVPGAEGKPPLRVWGTDFFWPMAEGENPSFATIPSNTDVLIAHAPPKGHLDGGGGCQSLAAHVGRVKPSLYVCGHIHGSHGVEQATGICYANAANARRGHGHMGWAPIIVDL
jgi:hypothetical protein